MPQGGQPPPSIADLKHLCLKSKEAWISRVIYRKVSIPVTWILIRTPATPNLVSLLGAIFGLVGLWALTGLGAQPTWWLRAAGLLLLQWAIILDHVDGELARARQAQSPGGYFVDNFVMEILVHLALAAAIPLAVWADTGQARWLAWGAAFLFLKSVNLSTFLLKGVVSLKHPPEQSARPTGQKPARTPLRQRVAAYWWEVKKMINAVTLLVLVEYVLTAQGHLPVTYYGLDFTLLGAYVAIGIPLLALSILFDVWAAARGSYWVDMEPYQ